MDTTEKNRVVKSKDAFDKKEVIIMSKKRSLRFSIVRGALAIGIALLVAFLLILSATSFGAS